MFKNYNFSASYYFQNMSTLIKLRVFIDIDFINVDKIILLDENT